MPGTVTFAGWKFTWSIPRLSGEGLVIAKADFQGRRVLYRAGQPFVLVPYHGNFPTFKDGLGSKCGGVPYSALIPTAPNVTVFDLPPGSTASNDNQYDKTTNPGGAVMVEQLPATLTDPATGAVWAKFQVGNYQYIHRWEFKADGAIEAIVGLGGRLWTTNPPTMGHIHNFYFRLDFDIARSANNLVRRFAHAGNNPGNDIETDITVESKEIADATTFTKWRVLNRAPKANGQLRSYELIPASDGGPDGTYSTGDLWVVRYKPSGEDGANVGCNDQLLGTAYANGESVNGEDVVVWYCLRHHHQPRPLGEEDNVLPYEFHRFSIEPRDFLDHTPKNLYTTSPPSPS